MPHKDGDDITSVVFNDMPAPEQKYEDNTLEEKWNQILEVRADVSKVLETARAEKVIGHSLNAVVHLYADGKTYEFLKQMEPELATIFITSAVNVCRKEEAPENATAGETVSGLSITAAPANGEKCERCWIYSDTVGKSQKHPHLCDRCTRVVEALSEDK